MNRAVYFNFIQEKLATLALRINQRGKLNLLDLNIYLETFYADLFNLLFNFQLVNLNEFKQNAEGIDLVDSKNEILVQVSATCTKQKIEDSLSKKIYSNYAGYKYKFISISKEAGKLRKNTFKNPHNMLFDPNEDIVDTVSILRIILNKSIDEQKILYEFVKKELCTEIDIIKVDTNLAAIINILATENLIENVDSPEINSFEVDKKIAFNDLISVKDTINDYKIYYHKLDEKYSEFDRAGSNKSFSVFQIIRKQYTMMQKESRSSQEVFFGIVNNIIDIIVKSANYAKIPYEELEMCVDILIVDAFIRCKIFNNPEGYKHVTAR